MVISNRLPVLSFECAYWRDRLPQSSVYLTGFLRTGPSVYSICFHLGYNQVDQVGSSSAAKRALTLSSFWPYPQVTSKVRLSLPKLMDTLVVLPHLDTTAQTLLLSWPFPPSSGLNTWKAERASAAKLSTKHSNLWCSSNHMIVPFKKSKTKPIPHSITAFKTIHF